MVLSRILYCVAGIASAFAYIRYLMKIRRTIWYYSHNHQHSHSHRSLYQIKVIYMKRRVKGIYVVILIKPLI